MNSHSRRGIRLILPTRNGRYRLATLGPPNPCKRNRITVRGMHPRVEGRMSIHTRRRQRRRQRRRHHRSQFVGQFAGQFAGLPPTRIYPKSIRCPLLVGTRLYADRRVDSRMRRDETRTILASHARSSTRNTCGAGIDVAFNHRAKIRRDVINPRDQPGKFVRHS